MEKEIIVLEPYAESNKEPLNWNLIKRYKSNKSVHWITSRGKSIKVNKMETDHIINTYNFLFNRKKYVVTEQWLYIFGWELAKRGIDITTFK